MAYEPGRASSSFSPSTSPIPLAVHADRVVVLASPCPPSFLPSSPSLPSSSSSFRARTLEGLLDEIHGSRGNDGGGSSEQIAHSVACKLCEGLWLDALGVVCVSGPLGLGQRRGGSRLAAVMMVGSKGRGHWTSAEQMELAAGTRPPDRWSAAAAADGSARSSQDGGEHGAVAAGRNGGCE